METICRGPWKRSTSPKCAAVPDAVIQNRGPGIIGVPWRDDALQKIVPGGLWVMPVVGAISVENVASASAVVQIEFLPKIQVDKQQSMDVGQFERAVPHSIFDTAGSGGGTAFCMPVPR